jgi:ABC-type sugar transport system permease subunit
MALPAAVATSGGADFHRRKPGLLAWLVLLPLVVWLLLFVVAPTVMLVVVSFAERDALGLGYLV